MPVTRLGLHIPFSRSSSYPQEEKTDKDRGLDYLDLSSIGIECSKVKTLHKYKIDIHHGNLGDAFTSTSNSQIYYFLAADNRNQNLLFKIGQDKENNMENSSKSDPNSSNSNYNIAIRNIMSRLFAKEIGIGHLLPEYGLGISNARAGTIMNKINGLTVHQWLIDNGYVTQALNNSIHSNRLRSLIDANHSYQFPEFTALMGTAFATAITGTLMDTNWQNIRFLDFLTGQKDRSNLKNLMVTTNALSYKELMAIDNDMTFPVKNDPLPKNVPLFPPTSFSTSGIHKHCTKLTEITRDLLPAALPALNERLDRFTTACKPCSVEPTLQLPEDEFTLNNENRVLNQPAPYRRLPLPATLRQTITKNFQRAISCYTIRRCPSNASISSSSSFSSSSSSK